MKLCKDCKWSSDEGGTVMHPSSLWGCSNDKCGSKIDVVAGQRLLIKCSHARSDGGACGREGKYWEERQ